MQVTREINNEYNQKDYRILFKHFDCPAHRFW